MNPEEIRGKVILFQKELEEECYTYGWNRAMQSAAQLYVNNISIEEENDILYYKMEKYKNKYGMMIDTEIKSIIDDLTETVIKENEQIQSNKYIVKIIKNEN